jgi:uncharacterized membrane protein
MPNDHYCGACGAKQPASSAPPSASGLSGISGRNASLLCYIPFVGWIASIVVLAAERFRADRTVRFHAFQGLYLFVAWLIVDWALGPMLAHAPGFSVGVGSLLKLALFGVWIFMLIKTSQDEMVRLPILGDLADRSLAEQR